MTQQTETKAKHTPGPWITEHDGKRWVIGCPDFLGRHVAYLSSGGVPEEEEPANARLIAAAPELLAALKHIAKTWPDDFAAGYARAAIAKAEGR